MKAVPKGFPICQAGDHKDYVFILVKLVNVNPGYQTWVFAPTRAKAERPRARRGREGRPSFFSSALPDKLSLLLTANKDACYWQADKAAQFPYLFFASNACLFACDILKFVYLLRCKPMLILFIKVYLMVTSLADLAMNDGCWCWGPLIAPQGS